MRALAWLLPFATLACGPTIPEGELVCTVDDECPDDWFCHRNGRCYSEAQGPVACEREPTIAEVVSVPDAISPKLDVLFVIDDSNANTSHQDMLAAQVPQWIEALTSGDADGDGVSEFSALDSIHFGVITSSMGTAPHDDVPSCAGLGDDGELITTPGRLDGCDATYPRVLEYEFGGPLTLESIAADLDCLVRRGDDTGCGFEQPLEAMLKALTPSTSPIEFLAGTGRGDGTNAGFLRDDAILAIVVLSSEDDCSAENRALYAFDHPDFGEDINLRCAFYREELFPIERYADGLLALKPDPSQLVVSFVTGTPADAGPTFPDSLAFDELLADPRMEDQVDPEIPIQLKSICPVDDGVLAPGRRFVALGRELQSAGAVVALPSLCAPLEGVFDAILETLQRSLVPECVSGTAVAAGRCQIVDPLPEGERCADEGLELAWSAEGREVCRVPFLSGDPPTEGVGWYLDQRSDEAREICPRGQGLATGFGRTLDGDTQVQCEDPDVGSIGRECTVGADACGDIGVACDPSSFTCQLQCRRDQDCGGGFVCSGLSETVAIGVCSNPTCG